MNIVVNPNFTAASPVTAQDKTDIQAALVALAAMANPSFSDIRAALAVDKRARFTDGLVHQTALELGLVVKPE